MIERSSNVAVSVNREVEILVEQEIRGIAVTDEMEIIDEGVGQGRRPVHIRHCLRHPRSEVNGARRQAESSDILRIDVTYGIDVSRAADSPVHDKVEPAG
jgi:hypothetical protein